MMNLLNFKKIKANYEMNWMGTKYY